MVITTEGSWVWGKWPKGVAVTGAPAEGQLQTVGPWPPSQPGMGTEMLGGWSIMSPFLCRVLQGNLATQVPWAPRGCL